MSPELAGCDGNYPPVVGGVPSPHSGILHCVVISVCSVRSVQIVVFSVVQSSSV